MQIARLAGARAGSVRLLATARAIHLYGRGAVAVAIAAAPVGGCGGGGGGGFGGRVWFGLEGGLLSDFFEDLFEEGGERGGFAAAEEGEGAVLNLGGPVVLVGVERVEEMFLDSAKGGKGKGRRARRVSSWHGRMQASAACFHSKRTYFLSWPPATNWTLSCDLRSWSMVAGV